MGRVVSEQRGNEPAVATAPDESHGRSRSVRSVLDEEREFFLRSLRDLEAERAAGDIDEVDYVALRDDYTVRAAHVLRQLAFLAGDGPDPDALRGSDSLEGGRAADGGRAAEGGRAPQDGPDAAARESPAALTDQPAGAARDCVSGSGQPDGRVPQARLKRVLTGVAVVLIVGGVAWVALGAAGVRLPGEASRSSPAEQATQLVIKAEAAEASNNPAQALEDYQGAVNKDPSNYEALTGAGAILVEAGASGRDRKIVDQGISELGKAESIAPNYGPAYAYRGLGYYYEGNFNATVPQLEIYVADTPARVRIASVTSLLAKAKAKIAAAKVAAAS
jgi:tetratricopeptide (TPR) repeat protein